MKIHDFDVITAPEEVRQGLYRVAAAIELEEFPDDEPAPYEFHLNRWRTGSTPHGQITRHYVEDGGEVTAFMFTGRWPIDDPTNSFVVVWVHPDHRRKGTGKALLARAIDLLEPHGVEKVIVDVDDGSPWVPAMERLGFKKSLTDKRGRLQISDLDLDLMDSWIARARERASEYDIVHLTSPIPEEYLERWCEMTNVMNTAPMEDLEIADHLMTPERWRADERLRETRGDIYLAAGALHRPSGRFAGFSEIYVQRYHPKQALQHDTGVDPDHRNRGLGRWLKAEMIKRLVRDHPEVERVDTWNAGSNAPMLAINDEMGFRPVLLTHAYQASFADIRSRLS